MCARFPSIKDPQQRFDGKGANVTIIFTSKISYSSSWQKEKTMMTIIKRTLSWKIHDNVLFHTLNTLICRTHFSCHNIIQNVASNFSVRIKTLSEMCCC